MQFHQTRLANGLEIVAETNPAARSAAIGFFVRTGARDETPQVSGVSHFLEHMVFKGTERRTALDVNRDFDVIGAQYNAFTSEENTVFHAAVLPEYLPQAVDILADILRPSLRAEDFDMEKKVILEEIGMYDDQPMWSTYDAAKQAFFARHPLGNSVLGSRTSVGGLTREQMLAYFQQRYLASNITVAAAGRLEWPALVDLVDRHCRAWPAGRAGRQVEPTAGERPFRVIPREKVVQEHVFLLSPGPAADSELRYAAEVLASAVGDESGSRLYWALIDPGLADAADLSFHEYEGTGAFYTYVSGDPDRAQENLRLIHRVLRDVTRDGLTEEEIAQAKSKLGSRVVRGGERPMGRMQALGFHWIYLRQYRTVDQDLEAIDAVAPRDIRALLDRYPLDQTATVALGPLENLQPPGDNGA